MGGGGNPLNDFVDAVGDFGTAAFHGDVKGVLAPVLGFSAGNLLGGISSGILGMTYGNEVYYTLSGEKDRDQRAMSRYQDQLNSIAGMIGGYQDRLGNKVFLEEIFKYGDKRMIASLGNSYNDLLKQYEGIKARYNDMTDVGFLGDIILFVPNVISALVYNIIDYIKTGDSQSLRTAIQIGALVAAVIASVLLAPETGGSTLQATALALAALSAILTLDAMVNGSGLLGSAFKIFDVVLNEILHVNSVIKQSEGFDKDSAYYERMQTNFKLAVQVGALATGLAASYQAWANQGAQTASDAAGAAGRQAVRNMDFGAYITGSGAYQPGTSMAGMSVTTGQVTNAMQAGTTVSAQTSSFFDGIISPAVRESFSQLYEMYNKAQQVGSVIDAFSIKQKIEEKLAVEKDKIESDILKLNKKKFEATYSDAEYIMNQTDMSYHSYVLDMSEAGSSDFFDPQGTIVMNTRYRPAQSFQFGFEEMFSYNSMAGGDMYVYKTLWGTK